MRCLRLRDHERGILLDHSSQTSGSIFELIPTTQPPEAKEWHPAAGGLATNRDRTLDRTAAETVDIQGHSLKTFSFQAPDIERLQVELMTEGRHLESEVQLWQGPNNTPLHMRVYVQDGNERPFRAVIETPGCPNTLQVRNLAQMEFPMKAAVTPNPVERPTIANPPMAVQGGGLRTFSFDPYVERAQVLLETDGRPLNARIELLQGPNNEKQVIELYTDDGLDRPFFMVLETPGAGNVIRIVNSATLEFPLMAWVEPYGEGYRGGNRGYGGSWYDGSYGGGYNRNGYRRQGYADRFLNNGGRGGYRDNGYGGGRGYGGSSNYGGYGGVGYGGSWDNGGYGSRGGRWYESY